MKNKIFLAFCALMLPLAAFAGQVKTKDNPDKKCGGYHGGSYHLKCEDEKTAKDGYVKRKHHWHNPFSGFTKGNNDSKPTHQHTMPTDARQ